MNVSSPQACILYFANRDQVNSPFLSLSTKYGYLCNKYRQCGVKYYVMSKHDYYDLFNYSVKA